MRLTKDGWECEYPDLIPVLNILTEKVLFDRYPLKYDPYPLKAIEDEVLELFKATASDEIQSDNNDKEKRVETEKGRQQMFESAEGFLEYYYQLE